MTTLPPELLLQTLTHLLDSKDIQTLTSCRLVSHALDSLTFPLLFSHLILWLDPVKSHRAVQALAGDLCNRPAVMWSPWASESDVDVDSVWLGVLWRVLTRSWVLVGEGVGVRKGGMRDGRGEEGEEDELLAVSKFGRLSGMVHLDEKGLRMGWNRFLLHRRYSVECARVLRRDCGAGEGAGAGDRKSWSGD